MTFSWSAIILFILFFFNHCNNMRSEVVDCTIPNSYVIYEIKGKYSLNNNDIS